MASVKKPVAPEFRVFMNHKTGKVVQLDAYLRSDQQQEEGLEQVFLCWHDGSDCLFVDPVMSRKEPRHDGVEYLDLIEFRDIMRRTTGVELPLQKEEGRLVSQWLGINHSEWINATLAPKGGLKDRMRRLDAALAKLTETIEGLL